MTSAIVARALALASAAALAVAGVRWRRAEPVAAPVAESIVAARVHAEPIGDSVLADAEDYTVSNDPFRLSNSPPSVRYDPAADGIAPGYAAPAIPPPRPVLVLKAIVGGPPWQAVIDGIPGQPAGTVARAGARFDRIVVRAVTRDSVIVQGADTSWVLSFRGRS